MSIRRSAVLGTIFVLALQGAAAAQSAAPAAPPEGIPWTLTELRMDGELSGVPEGVVTTLLMEGGQASGNAGCNSYSGPYTLRAEKLAFGPLLSTSMMCDDAAMSTESAYLAHLALVASFTLDRRGLTMVDTSGEPLLVFEEAEPASIVGDWVVTSYRTGSGEPAAPIAGSLLTATFGVDGSLEGSSGCNHFSASYTVDGGGIEIGTPGSTRMACATPELQSQEDAFLAALTSSTDWARSGPNLELADDSGLIGEDVTVTLTAATDASYVGSWIVTGYDQGNGSLVAPTGDAPLTAEFSVDGEIMGSSGCNLYSGPYTVSGSAMTVGPLASTRMTCSGELDDQEQRYLEALQLVTSWASDESGIALLAGDGVTKVTLAAAQ